MKNVFLQYFGSRLSTTDMDLAIKDPNIITISRQPGCNAKLIARLLREKFKPSDKWQLINRQILEESAKELDMEIHKVSTLLTSKQRGVFAEILDSFSTKQFKSDRKVKQTVFEMMESFMQENNTIIVGRGGIHICGHEPNTLHIRLTAPLDWRIKQIQKRYDMTREEAFTYVNEEQLKRDNFIASMQELSSYSRCFDVTINCSTFTIEQIVNIIYDLFTHRKEGK
jgi:cytidylate kinase